MTRRLVVWWEERVIEVATQRERESEREREREEIITYHARITQSREGE